MHNRYHASFASLARLVRCLTPLLGLLLVVGDLLPVAPAAGAARPAFLSSQLAAIPTAATRPGIAMAHKLPRSNPGAGSLAQDALPAAATAVVTPTFTS